MNIEFTKYSNKTHTLLSSLCNCCGKQAVHPCCYFQNVSSSNLPKLSIAVVYLIPKYFLVFYKYSSIAFYLNQQKLSWILYTPCIHVYNFTEKVKILLFYTCIGILLITAVSSGTIYVHTFIATIVLYSRYYIVVS